MNKCYSKVWNAALGQVVVASELASSDTVGVVGGASSSGRPLVRLGLVMGVLLAAFGVLPSVALAADAVCVDPANPSTTVPATSTGVADGQVVCGEGAAAGTANSIAIGNNAFAGAIMSNRNNTPAVAIGNNARANAFGSVAIGDNAVTSATPGGYIEMGAFGVAIGASSKATGVYGVAIGHKAEAGMPTNISIGFAAGQGQLRSAKDNISIGAVAGSDEDLKYLSADTVARIKAMGGYVGGVASYFDAAYGNGAGQSVRGDHNLAMGNQAGRFIDGPRNQSFGDNAGNFVKGSDNLAMGAGAGRYVAGSGNTSLGMWSGDPSYVWNADIIQINSGGKAVIEGNNNVAQGTLAGIGVSGDNNIAMGNQAGGGGGATWVNGVSWSTAGRLTGSNNIAIGNKAGTGGGDTTVDNSIAMGNEATATKNNAIALGNGAKAKGESSISIGTGNTVNADRSGAIGDPTIIDSPDSYSVGNNNNIASGQTDVFALGNNITQTVSNSVALGSNAAMTAATAVTGMTIRGTAYTYAGGAPVGVVSVGDVGKERQIQNVAAGQVTSTSTDAVNGSQLFATTKALNDLVLTTGVKYFSVNSTGGTNEDNKGATGADAIASGKNASATANTSVAMGLNSQTVGTHGGVAIGGADLASRSNIAGRESVAVGFSSNANATLGDKQGGVAVGAHANAGNASYNTALGYKAQADGALLGDGSWATSVGAYSQAKDTSAVAVGGGAKAMAANSITIGSWVTNNQVGAILMGNALTSVGGANAVAIGIGAKSNNANDLALGSNSVTAAPNPTATGTINGVTYDYTGTNPTSVVSVGDVGAERQITNVAAGRVNATSTDAINGSQLYATNTAIENVAGKLTHYYSVGSTGGGNYNNDGATGTDAIAAGKDASATGFNNIAMGRGSEATGQWGSIAMGGAEALAGNPKALTNIAGTASIAIGFGADAVARGGTALGTYADAGVLMYNVSVGYDASSGANSNFATNIGAYSQTNGVFATAVGSGAKSLADGAVTVGAYATNAQKGGVLVGTYLTQVGGENAVALGNAANAKNANDVALGANSVTAAANATASGTIAGVTYNYAGTTPTSVVSVGAAGAERQITNVAAGRVDATSTDAINGSQLYATNKAIADNKTKYYSVNSTGGTNEDNLGATGLDAIASGKNASAISASSIAMGVGAKAGVSDPNAKGAIAIGGASGSDWAMAGGKASNVASSLSVAIGFGSNANITQGNGEGGVAIGSYSNAGTGPYSTAVGYRATAKGGLIGGGTSSTAIGSWSTVDGASSTGVGTGVSIKAVNATAIGTGARITADQAIAVGFRSKASGLNAISIGVDSDASGEQSIAVGFGNKVSGKSSGAFGDPNEISGNESYAVGNNNTVAQDNTFVVGNGVTTTQANSVVLGNLSTDREATAESKATISGVTYSTFASVGSPANGVVSVGAKGAERQIINVAAGKISADSTDAINGSQLYLIQEDNIAKQTHYYSVNSTGGGNYNNDGATGTDAIASGKNARSTGTNSIAMGMDSNALTDGSVALGWKAGQGTGGGVENAAVGANAGTWITGQRNVAMGSSAGSNTVGSYNNAIGYGAGQFVKGDRNTAIGIGAGQSLTGTQNIGIGDHATRSSTGDLNIGLGLNAGRTITGSNNIALGDSAGRDIAASRTISIGSPTSAADRDTATKRTVASADDAVAIGTAAQATGLRSISIGTGNVASGEQSIAIGTGNKVSGKNSGAFGDPNDIAGNESYAVGNNNTIPQDNTFVVGNGVTTTQANSVVLGNLSTDRAATAETSATINGRTYGTFAGVGSAANGVVSVGAVGAERQIINVAAGKISADSTDAINGSQLYYTNTAIGDVAGKLTHYYSVNDGGTQQANYNNDGATGTNAIAAGVNASATGSGAVAMGANSTANGAWGSVAIGGGVTGKDNIAGKGSVAVGFGSQANASEGDSSGGSAFGTYSNTGKSSYNTALGYKASADGTTVGDGSFATAVGAFSSAKGTLATALGSGAAATADQAITVGAYATNAQKGAIVIGDPTTQVGGEKAVAVGMGANAAALNDVAVGAGSTTGGTTAVNSATVGGITYGGFAGNTPDSAFAVGSAGKERQVQHVAAGQVTATSTDAINGSQLYATNKVIDTFAQSVAAGMGPDSTIGPDGKLSTVINVNGTAYNNVEEAIQTVNNTASAGWNLSANGGTPVNIAPGATVDLKNTDGNIVLTQDPTTGDTSFDLADTIKIGGAAGTTIDANGVTLSGGSSLTNTGLTMAPGAVINMGGNVVTGVADGAVNATSKDAVNGSQLYATNVNVTNAQNTANTALDTANKGIKFGNGVDAPTQFALGDTINVKGDANILSKVTADGVELSLGNIVTIGGAAPVIINGDKGTIGGLTNTTFNPATIVSGQAATEDQLAQVNTAAVKAKTTVTQGENMVVTKTTNADGSDNYEVATAKDVTFDTVQVGGVKIDGATNVISGLAPGALTSTSSEAVNGSQLYQTNNIVNNLGSTVASGLGGSSTYDPVTGTVTTSLTVNGTKYDNVNDALQNVNSVANAGWNLTANKGASGSNVAPGGTVDLYNNDGNIVVTKTDADNNVAFDLAKDIKVDSVTAGNTKLDTNGMTTTDGTNTATFGPTGMTLSNGTVINTTNVTIAGGTTINMGNNIVSGVAAGVADTDAVNVSQLKAIAAGSGKSTVSAGNNTVVSTTTNADGTTNYQVGTSNNVAFDTVKVGNVNIDGATGKISGVTAGDISANSTDAVNGSQLYATNQKIDQVSQVANAGWNISAQGKNATNVKPGAKVDLHNTDGNIVVSKSTANNDINFDLAKNIKVDSVVLGNDTTTINQNGLIITNGPSVTANGGINAGGMAITNVKAGSGPTDAVNVSQLQAATGDVLNQANSYTDVQINGVRQDLWRVDRGYRGGTASAMAMATLPQAYVPGKSMASIAASHYEGESGLAVGVSGVTENGRVVYKLNTSGNTTGQWGVAVGAGLQW